MPIAIDPVCKMDVDTGNPPGGESEYQGTTYYFCAPGCKVAFDRDPDGFLEGDGGGHGHSHSHTAESPEEEKKPGFLAKLFGRR